MQTPVREAAAAAVAAGRASWRDTGAAVAREQDEECHRLLEGSPCANRDEMVAVQTMSSAASGYPRRTGKGHSMARALDCQIRTRTYPLSNPDKTHMINPDATRCHEEQTRRRRVPCCAAPCEDAPPRLRSANAALTRDQPAHALGNQGTTRESELATRGLALVGHTGVQIQARVSVPFPASIVSVMGAALGQSEVLVTGHQTVATGIAAERTGCCSTRGVCCPCRLASRGLAGA